MQGKGVNIRKWTRISICTKISRKKLWILGEHIVKSMRENRQNYIWQQTGHHIRDNKKGTCMLLLVGDAIYYHHHNHHNHISVMELGHLLTLSGLTYPEVSSKVCHDFFYHLGNSVSLLWVDYLHVVSSFSCILVIFFKLVLFLIPLQFVYLFCNLSKCILLFFSCISCLLLLLFWCPLL